MRHSSLPDLKVNRRADRAVLDKISSNRNHQNVALECSRLPFPPLASLGYPTFDPTTNVPSIPLAFADTKRSPEDIAIDGNDPTLALARSHIKPWHKPLVVFLDGILDPQNLGNILRTCHFYNVTAVAIATNTCAPISSATLAKASSGACEAIPLFAVSRPSDFIYQSARAGWRVDASVAPSGDWGANARESAKAISTADVKKASPLAKKPTILMLGAEGEGLRKNLVRHADGLVSIMPAGGVGVARSQKHDVGVDSLNVGTAAGVLLEAYYTEPLGGNRESRSTGGDKIW
ncbi:hypothetical protein K431DRAFT_213927 [Polychaeton citri CBS 116435]|uniref:tRNA/rRNA methyltransferase SpoU type domain-containing protein n=1 Tax=Polychaeton citri CBS 116435 TaxID=1314669 RepID=A0A9P4QHU5_9PEZI|nr:hypothetical protein K431DRAFT_213927 [Polychaeton citri CBS 116435]